MTVFALKIIAVLTMMIDHTASVLDLWRAVDFSIIKPLRCVGRMSFPIFAFLIANGYEHTRSPKRYCGRLLLFGMIAQLPFVWALCAADKTYPLFFTIISTFFSPWPLASIPYTPMKPCGPASKITGA